MNKTEDDRKEDRKKRIENTKSKEHLIKEDTSKSALDGKVIDVYDIIDKSSEPTIIRLRKLREFGVTDDMIAETYRDMAGNVENESNAIEVLDAVFKRIAMTINQQPNGIVINLTTGDLNKAASLRQAARVGVLDDDYYLRSKNKWPKSMFKSFKEDKAEAIKENKMVDKFSKTLNSYQGNNNYLPYLSKDPKNLNLTDTAKSILENVRNKLKNEDPQLMKLYRLEIQLDGSRNTPEYDVYLKQREEFLKENPAYEKRAKGLRDENGFLKTEVTDKYNKFNTYLKVNCLMSEIAMAKDAGVITLSGDQRKNLIISSLAGLHYGKLSISGLEIANLKKECWNVLEELEPSLKDKKNDFKGRLYKFLEKELELEDSITPDNFNNLMEICNEGIDRGLDYEKCIEALKLKDKEFDKYYRENSQDLNIQTEIENKDKSNLEKYFANSKINFSKEDEKKFNDIYKDCTTESWIDNKQDALILYYSTLIRTKDKLVNNEKDDYNDEKINQIEEKLQRFNEEHPNIKGICEDDKGNLKPEINEKANNYKNKMIESALLKFYSVDVIAENNGKSYQDLDDSHKKAYLRNVLVGLNYGQESQNKSILRLAQRRLELLNTADKTFISFDNAGNPIINQKAVLDEYQSMSDYKWNSFEELSDSAERRKDVYIIKKLDEYEKLQENDFIKLENPEDKESALAQIENIKARSNQIKSNELENNQVQEESYAIEVNNKTNGFFSRLKNLFNPRITDGTEENQKGLFSKIVDKIIGNKMQGDLSENNGKSQRLTSTMDDYIVDNQNSQIEYTAIQNQNSREEQTIKDNTYDRSDS